MKGRLTFSRIDSASILAFLADNPEYQSKVDEVRNIISRMQESESLKLSEEFDKKLANKIDNTEYLEWFLQNDRYFSVNYIFSKYKFNKNN